MVARLREWLDLLGDQLCAGLRAVQSGRPDLNRRARRVDASAGVQTVQSVHGSGRLGHSGRYHGGTTPDGTVGRARCDALNDPDTCGAENVDVKSALMPRRIENRRPTPNAFSARATPPTRYGGLGPMLPADASARPGTSPATALPLPQPSGPASLGTSLSITPWPAPPQDTDAGRAERARGKAADERRTRRRAERDELRREMRDAGLL